MATPTTIPSRRTAPTGDKEAPHLHWGRRAGSAGGSDPPGPVCRLPGLSPRGAPPRLPGPLCLRSQGAPCHGHHLPGRPDGDTAVSIYLPALPASFSPPVTVLTWASVSSGGMGPEWALSLWARVSVVEGKGPEKTPQPLNATSSAAPRPLQAQPGWERQDRARME